jgi:streptomycin 6-kinase
MVVAALAAQWSLDVGHAFTGCHVSFTAPVWRVGRGEAVLKVQFPHPESEHEADALRAWNGDGAVRLLDHDPTRHALLLERCLPGDHLADLGVDRALDALIGLLPRLWVPNAEPFTSLADEAVRWSESLPSRYAAAGSPCEPRLLDAALEALDELGPTQSERVLLHQDLHADNVVAAEREPWLVIDPKPLVGERAFAVAPIVRSWELGHSRAAVLHRFDRLTEELGLDRDRARGWTIGQTVAWAMSDPQVHDRHIAAARWLLDAA